MKIPTITYSSALMPRPDTYSGNYSKQILKLKKMPHCFEASFLLLLSVFLTRLFQSRSQELYCYRALNTFTEDIAAHLIDAVDIA